MSKIYSFYGGGYVALTEVNGKTMKAEFTDIVDAAKWIKKVESTEVKEDEG